MQDNSWYYDKKELYVEHQVCLNVCLSGVAAARDEAISDSCVQVCYKVMCCTETHAQFAHLVRYI